MNISELIVHVFACIKSQWNCLLSGYDFKIALESDACGLPVSVSSSLWYNIGTPKYHII